jgi:hypothetical protein
MKTVLSILFLLCFKGIYAFNTSDTLKKRPFTWSFQIMVFGRTTGFQDKTGSLNPENRIAKINNYDGGLYLRPEFKYKLNKFDFWVKPRLHLDFPKNVNPRGTYVWEFGNNSSEVFFQELKSRWQINDKIFIQGGRYFKQIGTSIFINPSNPFIVNTSRLNPKIELVPMDFVEVNFTSNDAWNYTLIANLGAAQTGIYKEPFFDFSRKYGLLIEHYGASDNAGLILSMDENQKYHLGGYAQKNVSDALLIWTDFSVDYRINRFYPVVGNQTKLIDYEMVNGSENDKLFVNGLIGASYTFNWGPTLQVEYYHNGKGYNDEQFKISKDLIASGKDFNFDVTRKLTDLNLGRTINTGLSYNRQNYLFTQLNQNDLFGKLNVNLRNLYSIDDGVNQLSTLLEYDVADNLEIYGIALNSTSPKEIDLTKLINYQVMIGLIAKF